MASTVTSAVTNNGTYIPLSAGILDVYSREVLFEASALLRFEQICSQKEELGVLPGNTIKFLRYQSLRGSYTLTEGTDMETKAVSGSQITISVGERGFAVAETEYLLRTSFDDTLRSMVQLLGQHFATSRDNEIRDKLYELPTTLYAKGKAGRTSLGTADTFDLDLIRDAVEQLATNKAPKFGGDAYICFIHPRQAKYIRRDPAWINIQNYNNGNVAILQGEIGRFENVRFIETTQIRRISKVDGSVYVDSYDTGADLVSYSTNADVYSAIIVGDHVIGLAIALEAQLRDNGVKDFGRKHEIGYYGIWGTGLIETGHGLILESA